MGMSEREHHIKTLEQFLHDYQEWGEDLGLEKTIKYAISSLKTDESYQLMYEGEEIYTNADMVAMLKEISKQIEEEREDCLKFCNCYERFAIKAMAQRSQIVIKQKIDALKGAEDDNR